MPKNDLHLEDNKNKLANITEQEFKDITNEAVDLYQVFATRSGATIRVVFDWSSSTVNAYAQQSGADWHIEMYGGLARREEVTKDGYALVVCHELSHHFGGYAFYNNIPWASNEGNSDYIGSSFCLRTLWRDKLAENTASRLTVDPTAKAMCDAAWATPDSQNLCYRIAMAGQSLANLLSRGANPQFDTPDTSEVASTRQAHPAAQCRLDTYLQGALCTTDVRFDIIPGKTHPDGRNNIGAEEVANRYSCARVDGFAAGIRPRCWFKPQISR